MRIPRPNMSSPTACLMALKPASALWQTSSLPMAAVSTGVQQEDSLKSSSTTVVSDFCLGGVLLHVPALPPPLEPPVVLPLPLLVVPLMTPPAPVPSPVPSASSAIRKL